MGQALSDVKVSSAVEDYGEHFKEAEPTPTVELPDDVKFYSAFEQEMGARFADYRLFVDGVEDLAIRAGKAVIAVRRSKLFALAGDGKELSGEACEQILQALALAPRNGWREDVAGVDPRDLQLGRYRRRVSVLRKPLFQIDQDTDPTLLVAPGLLRQGLLYTTGNMHQGGFPDWQLCKAMRSWAAVTADKRGRRFSQSIATKLGKAGWSVAEPDLKITKLLGRGFDRDYGDVDVLVWCAETRRVVVIECKDVQFKKSIREMAEQLADFRGEVVNGKRDYLRRHLDRIDLIRQHLPELAHFIGLDRVLKLESYLVFKNPGPMQFALDHLYNQVRVSNESSLLAMLQL